MYILLTSNIPNIISNLLANTYSEATKLTAPISIEHLQL